MRRRRERLFNHSTSLPPLQSQSASPQYAGLETNQTDPSRYDFLWLAEYERWVVGRKRNNSRCYGEGKLSSPLPSCNLRTCRSVGPRRHTREVIRIAFHLLLSRGARSAAGSAHNAADRMEMLYSGLSHS